MIIRASALPTIMTNPRTKGEVLSETAKSYLKKIAKEDFYGYTATLENKYLTKGIEVEAQAIELYNEVFFTNYTKNEVRETNEWLTGECDIDTGTKIIDIKSSWSLDTFPATEEDVNIKDYEMQLRGYMMLYNRDEAEVAYCIVSTPEELCKWENQELHQVDHIDPRFRVTVKKIKRDLNIEMDIEAKCKASIEYYTTYINQLYEKNS